MVHRGIMENGKTGALENVSHFKGIFQRSAVAFFVKVAGLAAGFVFTYIVTRYYGAETFGLLSICLNMVQVTVLLTVMGFDNVLMKFVTQKAGDAAYQAVRLMYVRIVKTVLPITIVWSGIFFLAADLLAEKVFHKPELGDGFEVSSLMVLPLTFMLLHASGLRGLHKTGLFSFFRETSRFLFAVPLLLLLMYFYGTQQLIPLMAYSFSVFLAAVASYVLWMRHTKNGLDKNISGLPDMPGIIESMPFFMISALTMLSPVLNSLLLGVKGTVADVGVFNVAVKIASLLSLPLLAVNMASAPSFSRLYHENDLQAIQESATGTTRLIFWTSLPLLLCCVIAPAQMMELFGSNFGEGAWALVMIAIAQFINAISGSVGVIMQMTGQERPWGVILLFTTIMNVIMMLVLVPEYGINGAAASLMTVMIVNNIAGAVWLKMKLNIRTFYIPFISG